MPTRTDAPPPKDEAAEAALLGSLLLEPSRIDDVSLVLSQEDFFLPLERTVYETMLAMHQADRRIDVTLLTAKLKPHAAMFEERGGIHFVLAKYLDETPVASHATYYAGIIRDKALLRNLDRAGDVLQGLAADQEADPRELLQKAEAEVFSILERHTAGDVVDVRTVLMNAMDQIEARSKRGCADGIQTGYPDVDQLIGGLRPGELIILAARTSMGKTAFALNVCERVCITAKQSVLMVSLEMSSLEIGERMLCCIGKMNGFKLRGGFLSALDRKTLVEANATLSKARLTIDDSCRRSVNEIAAIARRLRRKEKLGLVVVDYLQLVQPTNIRESREQQVSGIAKRLKGMARELKVPVLCVAQLNRQNEQGQNKRPKLSHLRESGAIEQDSDLVLFVHREDYYRDEKDWDHVAEIIVAKNRNGPTGIAQLRWFKESMRFESLARDVYAKREDSYVPAGDYSDPDFPVPPTPEF